MDLLSIVGNVASILGLIASLWVLRQVRDVQRHYLRQVRSPVLLKQLAAQETTLSKLLLPSTLDTEQASVVLASSEALLRNLLPKLSGEEAKLAKKTLRRLTEARSQPLNRPAAIRLRADLVAIIGAATEQNNDTQWTH